MRLKDWIWLPFLVAGIVIGLSVSQARSKNQLNKKTVQDLQTAMKGEAFAYAKYMLYAEHARKNGHPEIADLFENAANTERFEHFAEEAELAGLVGTDADNLRDAIKGENYESTTMYKQFADKAASYEDVDVSERFEEIRKDEAKHRDTFQSALDKLTAAPQPSNRH